MGFYSAANWSEIMTLSGNTWNCGTFTVISQAQKDKYYMFFFFNYLEK